MVYTYVHLSLSQVELARAGARPGFPVGLNAECPAPPAQGRCGSGIRAVFRDTANWTHMDTYVKDVLARFGSPYGFEPWTTAEDAPLSERLAQKRSDWETTGGQRGLMTVAYTSTTSLGGRPSCRAGSVRVWR